MKRFFLSTLVFAVLAAFATAPVSAQAAATFQQVAIACPVPIPCLLGTNGPDNLTFGAGSQCANTIGGDDAIHGGGGADVLSGGDGNDAIWGDAGNDCLYGNNGSDTIRGGNGRDLIQGNAGDDALFGEGGDDNINGGSGNDFIDGGRHNNGDVCTNGPTMINCNP